MRISAGHGGWLGVDDDALPGMLYVRVRAAPDGRLRISELYLDASQTDAEITQTHLKDVPLSNIEAFANQVGEGMKRSIDEPSPDLSTLATYFRSGVLANWGDERNRQRRNWAVLALASQAPSEVKAWGEEPVPRAPRQRVPWDKAKDDREFRLSSGPGSGGLTDEFLNLVARAYAAALQRRERPNTALAKQTGYPVRTVQRWVYMARQRGIMARGRQGQAG